MVQQAAQELGGKGGGGKLAQGGGTDKARLRGRRRRAGVVESVVG